MRFAAREHRERKESLRRGVGEVFWGEARDIVGCNGAYVGVVIGGSLKERGQTCGFRSAVCHQFYDDNNDGWAVGLVGVGERLGERGKSWLTDIGQGCHGVKGSARVGVVLHNSNECRDGWSGVGPQNFEGGHPVWSAWGVKKLSKCLGKHLDESAIAVNCPFPGWWLVADPKNELWDCVGADGADGFVGFWRKWAFEPVREDVSGVGWLARFCESEDDRAERKADGEQEEQHPGLRHQAIVSIMEASGRAN